MDRQYADLYPLLYRHHWWWRARERFIVDSISRALPPGGWTRALDVGCGDGLFLDVLAMFTEHVEGIEIDGSIVSSTTHRSHHVHIGTLDETFQPGQKYDLITMLDVLEHMREPATALRRAKDLLVEDGVLLVTVPAFNSLWTGHDDRNHHMLRFRRRSLASLLASVGLRSHAGGYFFHWVVPLKLGVRLAEQLTGSEFHVNRPPGRLTNRICYSISRLEQRTISPNRWIPGSSLMILAGHEARPLPQ